MSPAPTPSAPPLDCDKVVKEAASLEGALRLASGAKDEERFLGVALALRHGSALVADPALRGRLVAAADAAFLQRLLLSQLPLRRVALAALRIIASDEAGAANVRSCAPYLAKACVEAVSGGKDDTKSVDSVAEQGAAAIETAWGVAEVQDVLEVLRQLLRFSPSAAAGTLVAAAQDVLELLAPGGALATLVVTVPACVCAALHLSQEIAVTRCRGGGFGAADASREVAVEHALLESLCLEPDLKGSSEQCLALGLLAERVEAGAAAPRLDEIIGHGLVACGEPARAPALQLAAASLRRHGLSFGLLGGLGARFGRLNGILSLAAAELHLGLEGLLPRPRLCAACMALEAAVVALGRQADEIETGGHLQAAADALRHVHRAMGDIYDYCIDLQHGDGVSGLSAATALPLQNVALIARVVAAWQLEDPRKFSSEFQRALPIFCRLPYQEFAMLLPCLHEMQDWHLTPAFAKVFEAALGTLTSGTVASASEGNYSVSADRKAGETDEVLRQCVLMLAEVALDASAYLPEAPWLPEAPSKWWGEDDAAIADQGDSTALASARRSRAATPFSTEGSTTAHIPRPVQASDPANPGAQKLMRWSCALWHAGASFRARRHRVDGQTKTQDNELLWELGTLCGALLVSVPEASAAATVSTVAHGRCDATHALTVALCGTWDAVARCLFAGPHVDAALWRLTLRLAGFALDRHSGLADALACESRATAVKRRQQRACVHAHRSGVTAAAHVATSCIDGASGGSTSDEITDFLVVPPPGALPCSDDDEDEWAFADRAVASAMRVFLEAEAALGDVEEVGRGVPVTFDEMD
eukprot:TRINITY_DN12716_c0_g1_i2.p1 TRINITY_DN12716_c0_g1~~TRINITY_DN12716_c0_g1_i2.p1  ORF type:complete len:820 (-),score=153.78 TRINITY_DN12716_c0_g1_i2:60-2519(-)